MDDHLPDVMMIPLFQLLLLLNYDDDDYTAWDDNKSDRTDLIANSFLV
jgi:hypothetical protein